MNWITILIVLYVLSVLLTRWIMKTTFKGVDVVDMALCFVPIINLLCGIIGAIMDNCSLETLVNKFFGR